MRHCHQASDNWTIIPAHLQARFDASNGTDPVGAVVDFYNARFAIGLGAQERGDLIAFLQTL